MFISNQIPDTSVIKLNSKLSIFILLGVFTIMIFTTNILLSDIVYGMKSLYGSKASFVPTTIPERETPSLSSNESKLIMYLNQSKGQNHSQSADVLKSLGPDVLKSLGPDVLKSLGPDVLKSLGPDVLKSLGPDVLKSLGPDVLQNDTNEGSSDAETRENNEVKDDKL